MPLGIQPTVDYVFKRLFGDPANADLLIHLLNAVLQPSVPITEVTIENPLLEKEFDEDKLAVLDIRACDVDRHWFNIEMQTTVPKGLSERLVYYTSCLYVEQMHEGMKYADLLPTISICFLSKSLFPAATPAHLRFALADLEHRISLTDRLQIHTIELAKYNQSKEQLPAAENLEKWTYFLKHAAALEVAKLQQLLPEPPYRKATRIIEMISQSPEQRRLYDARLRAQRDRFSEVEGAKEEALAEGRTEGFALGETVATIRILQQLLNEPPSDKDELAKMELATLRALAAELQSRCGRPIQG